MPILAAALFLIALPPAGDTPAAASEAIVVTGTPLTREEAREQALEFVRRTGVAEAHPIARWIAPVCPRVAGVEASVAAIVEERVRDVANEAGARVAAPGCAPNIAIIFTADGPATAQTLLRKSPHSFADLSAAARARLLEGDDAIRWLHTTRVQSRHGAAALGAPMPGAAGNGEGGGPIIGGGGLSQYNSSLISTQAVRALSTATIIIDVEKATGQPLDAIASFAAIVALAEMDGDPPPPADSILALFAGETDRRELSAQDAALLRAIYSLPPDREARQHRRQLVGAMTKDFSAE